MKDRSECIGKRSSVWRDHKAALCDAQNGVCAFCEHDASSSSFGDVEHYRPKGAVTPRSDGDPCTATSVPPKLDDSASTEGYWRLAFAWSNYLFACQLCNQQWKRDQFPLVDEGERDLTMVDGKATLERPLLLDPYRDDFDPRTHFEYVVSDAEIAMIGRTDEGRATIALCGLHRRDAAKARMLRLKEIPARVEGLKRALLATKLAKGDLRLEFEAWTRAWNAVEHLAAASVLVAFRGDCETFRDQLVTSALGRTFAEVRVVVAKGLASARRAVEAR
jgi:hypothetical protein